DADGAERELHRVAGLLLERGSEIGDDRSHGARAQDVKLGGVGARGGDHEHGRRQQAGEPPDSPAEQRAGPLPHARPHITPKTLPAFSQVILWVTSGGRWPNCSSMYFEDSGHTPSPCG